VLQRIAPAAADHNENESHVKKQLRTAALGALWNINRRPVRMLNRKSETPATGVSSMSWSVNNKTTSTAALKTDKKPLLQHRQHIMFSYSWDCNSEIVRKLNTVLQQKGYRTWIDVEQMSKWVFN
jgi:hypothetical protein